MFWFVIFLVCILLFILGILLEMFTDIDEDFSVGLFGTGLIMGIIMFMICGIGHMFLYTDKFDIREAKEFLPVKIEQREDLITLVKDELSAEQYQALLSLDNTENVIILFKDTAASEILISRVTAIVELNKDIFSLQNELLQLRMSVCNNQENIFVPRFPAWGLPDCDYQFISDK
jgi:hypothetical protein